MAASDAVGKDLAEILGKRENFLLETYPHFRSRLFGTHNEATEVETETEDSQDPEGDDIE